MAEVTDPKILEQLNAQDTAGNEVTDPAILSQLNSQEPTEPAQSKKIPQEYFNQPQTPVAPRNQNNPILEPFTAFGGGVQDALAQTAGQAVGSQGLQDALSPSNPVKQATESYPGLATAGYATGMTGAAIGATTAVAKGMVNPIIARVLGSEMVGGYLSSVGANAIASAILAGPGNRMLGGALGAAGGAVGTAVANSSAKVANMASINKQVDNVVKEVGKIVPSGDPAAAVAQSKANVWKVVTSVEDEMAQSLDASTTLTTVPTNAAKAAQKILDQYSKDPKQLGNLTTVEKQVLEQIAGWGKSTKVPAQTSTVLDASGAPIVTQAAQQLPPTKFSFTDLHKARRELDQIITQAFSRKEAGEISGGIANAMSTLRDYFEQDLLKAATKSGIKDAYLKFDSFYRTQVLPKIKDGTKEIAQLLDDTSNKGNQAEAAKMMDSLIPKYLNPNKPKTATNFIAGLDDAGKDAMQAAALDKALQSATDKTGLLDVQVFQQSTNTMLQKFPTLFNTKNRQMIQGLNKVIDEATTILGARVNPAKLGATAKLGAMVGAGSAAYVAGGLPAVAGVGITMSTLSKFINSPSGQSLLIKAGSKGGKEVINQIVNGLLIDQTLQHSGLREHQGLSQPTQEAPNGN